MTTPLPYAELTISGDIAIHGRAGTATLTSGDAARIAEQIGVLLDDEDDDTEPVDDEGDEDPDD